MRYEISVYGRSYHPASQEYYLYSINAQDDCYEPQLRRTKVTNGASAEDDDMKYCLSEPDEFDICLDFTATPPDGASYAIFAPRQAPEGLLRIAHVYGGPLWPNKWNFSTLVNTTVRVSQFYSASYVPELNEYFIVANEGGKPALHVFDLAQRKQTQYITPFSFWASSFVVAYQ